MRLLIMGAPGAGKSTQAAYLAHELGFPAISASDVSRAHVSAPTQLGLEAKVYVDAGLDVPDRVTNEIIRDRLVQQDAKHGWILHGYPRTLAQVNALHELCINCGHTLDAVIFLGVPDRVLVGRLLLQGSGDVQDLENRLSLYREQTVLIMSAYLRLGVLQVVDGRGSVSEVRERCLAAATGARSRVAQSRFALV
jgi:adenylate kinase